MFMYIQYMQDLACDAIILVLPSTLSNLVNWPFLQRTSLNYASCRNISRETLHNWESLFLLLLTELIWGVSRARDSILWNIRKTRNSSMFQNMKQRGSFYFILGFELNRPVWLPLNAMLQHIDILFYFIHHL